MTLLSTKSIPKRGEIWLINFDPTIGTEIKKTRPGVIISSEDKMVEITMAIATLIEYSD